jgi:hypothetical protein
MASIDEPACGTPGCFAGLISIVANDIPELKEIYKSSHEYDRDYSYSEWANALVSSILTLLFFIVFQTQPTSHTPRASRLLHRYVSFYLIHFYQTRYYKTRYWQ